MNNHKKKIQRVFREWKKLMGDYMRQVPDDLPYWNGERANVSFLAAAIWGSGGVAIGEYWTERKGSGKGWCDLYGKLGEMDFSMEAKQLWPARFIKKNIQDKLKECNEQLKSSLWKGQHLISICFLSPCFKNRNDYINKWGELIKEVEANFKEPVYFTDSYSPEVKDPDRVRYKKEGYYPGIIDLTPKNWTS